MKTIVRNSAFGLVALLALVWVSAPTPANALATCSTVPKPIMTIAISGYGAFSNSASNLDAVGSITVPYGTSLSATFSNTSIAADTYTLIDSWPGGSQTWNHMNPGSRTHATGALTANTYFNIYVSTACSPDPFPGPQSGPEGSVRVNVIVQAAPTPTATLTASPNPVNSGSPTTLTWTSTNATSCTATGGAGFSTGSATGGSDASSNLTSQTTFSMSCTGAGGSVTKSVTVGVNAAPTCSVSPSSAAPGATVVATAAGGTSGSYTWNTGGGSACAAGGTCSTSYGTAGSKTITVTRNSLTGTCPVTISTNPVNGICGSSNGGTFATAPTTNLCNPGTASAVSGGSSWTWTCAGSGGGTTASCSASMLVLPPTITCSGPSAGQTGVSYTFTGGGASSYTWAVSPTTGLTPAGASGSGTSVAKSFSAAGTKTVTFTNGAQSGQCTIAITATPPALSFNLNVNGWNNPPPIAYGTIPTISWTSSGADRIDDQGASPADTDWPGTSDIGAAGSHSISPLVRTVYSGRAVRFSPLPVTQITDSVTVRVQPQCLPAGQTATVNQPVSDSLEAAGGNGTYAWTATGATPASGTGATFVPTYSTTGTKTITLTSDSLSTTCTVTVNAVPVTTGTVIVNSVNAEGEAFLTTWELAGPSGGSQSQGTPSANATYTSMPTGSYNLTAGDVDQYTVAITPGGGQTLAAGGTITYTITYTPVPADPGEPWVDLTADPTKVAVGDSSMLSWTSDGIEPGTCVATGGWEKSRDDAGSESTGELTQDTSYTITCDKPQTGKGLAGTVSDTVNVSVVDVTGDDDDGTPDCSDGVNNDAGDELIDYPADPGCYGPEDPSEEDVPVPGDDDDVIIGACDDGFDNDGDGTIDGADTGCNSGDGTEQSEPDIREI